MSANDRYKRMQPVRVTPQGRVHMEDPGIPVRLTLRLTGPPLDYEVEGWAIAWTRNAVLAVWFDPGEKLGSGWIPPEDVKRRG